MAENSQAKNLLLLAVFFALLGGFIWYAVESQDNSKYKHPAHQQ
jgi:hypothetical protein